MRSILLQSRRVGSRAHPVVLPRLPSSSLLRRSNSTTPQSEPSILNASYTVPTSPPRPALLKHPPAPSPSQLPSSSRLPPPPPLDDSSSSRPITSRPSTATTSSTNSIPSSKSSWLNQAQINNHQAKAVALAARLEAQGSEGLVATSELLQARKLLDKVTRLARASDDHLRALSIIHQACSTSPAALQDDGREWIRRNTYRLLFLFNRRLNIKSDSLIPSLRLVLLAEPVDLDLLLSREAFRQIAVGLASGAKDASAAVEIVEGLRRLSPSSFTEVEFEELAQAIGLVKDWTATTPETFHLLSFPTPLRPLPPPPRPASPPAPLSRPSTPTKLTQLTSPPSSSSSLIKGQVPPPVSPPSSSTNAQAEELLQFSRAVLFNAPPPSADNLQFIYNLFKAAFPQPHDVANQARTEVAVRILVHASRAPPLPPQDRYRFAGLVSVVLHSIENLPFVDLDSFGSDVKKDLLSLVGRSVKRGQVRSLALFLYKSQRRDFKEEELKTIFDARDRLPVDARHLRALQIDEDWEKGFGVRLGEILEDASSSSNRSSSDTLNTDTDADWIEWSKQVLHRESYLKREISYGLLKRRSIQAPSSSESLVVASDLYSRYAPSNSGVPHKWRQHGDAIVRILLLFSNHQGDSPPPFKLLEPVLRHLPLLPPSFIPSTPSFPSFAVPLLPMANSLNESLLIVNTTLHAQEHNPAALLEIWSTFLSSLEQHSASPTANGIFASKLFNLVQTQYLLKEDRTGPTPLEDVVQMYLRRVESKGGMRAKGEELKGLEKLERLVTEREEGRERAESMKIALAEVRRLLETKKV